MVNLGPRRRYLWTFILNFLQFYGLLVDSRGLKLIDTSSDIKFTGEPARTDVNRITGVLSFNENPFQNLLSEFPIITKPIEETHVVTDRVAHHIVTTGPLVTARP